MEKDDLDLVDTSELIDALGRRFECVIVASQKFDNHGKELIDGTWRGGFLTACGLWDEIRYRLDIYRRDNDHKDRRRPRRDTA
jgi:hypothetical protein